MALTKQQITDLINTKLASNTSISADEHREIELALVTAIYEYSVQSGDIKEIAIANLNDFETSGANIGRGKVGTMRYGWAICNGYNGTVDKRGRVSTGINSSAAGGDSSLPVWQTSSTNYIGYKGGLEDAVVVIQNHTYNSINNSGKEVLRFDSVGNKQGASYFTDTTNAIGEDGRFKNLQPYVVSVFVQKIAENY